MSTYLASDGTWRDASRPGATLHPAMAAAALAAEREREAAWSRLCRGADQLSGDARRQYTRTVQAIGRRDADAARRHARMLVRLADYWQSRRS